MTESLREKVEAALRDHLVAAMSYEDPPDVTQMAPELTAVVFAALAGARPCVTCGKGIGPAKVAKGYVQCYGCRGTTALDRAAMVTAHRVDSQSS